MQDTIKVIRFFAVVAVILAVIALIDQQSKIKTGETIIEEDITSGESSQEETVRQEIHIPRNIQIAEGETVEIVQPKAVLTGLHSTDPDGMSGEVIEQLKTQGVFPQKGYGNEDGTITLVFDKIQLENYIIFIESALQDSIDSHENIQAIIREDFMQVTYYVGSDCTLSDFGVKTMQVGQYLVLAQGVSGVSGNEWTLTETIVYRETGQVMFELVSDKDHGYNLSAEEWEEKMQEMEGHAQE